MLRKISFMHSEIIVKDDIVQFALEKLKISMYMSILIYSM